MEVMPIIMVYMESNGKPANSTELKRKIFGLVRAIACPRCGGALSIESDVYGVYIACIQCGATWNKNDLKLVSVHHQADTIKAAAANPRSPSV
jgi:hypothetical protein